MTDLQKHQPQIRIKGETLPGSDTCTNSKEFVEFKIKKHFLYYLEFPKGISRHLVISFLIRLDTSRKKQEEELRSPEHRRYRD